jgi:hypothetical protein
MEVNDSYHGEVGRATENPTGRARQTHPLSVPVVFIHYPHSNPHPSQMGRVLVENYYPLKK